MSMSDWMYILLAAYLIIMGILGINLKVLWITFTLRVKVYDFEYLYGQTAARIMFILLGASILLVRFVLFKDFL